MQRVEWSGQVPTAPGSEQPQTRWEGEATSSARTRAPVGPVVCSL